MINYVVSGLVVYSKQFNNLSVIGQMKTVKYYVNIFVRYQVRISIIYKTVPASGPQCTCACS